MEIALSILKIFLIVCGGLLCLFFVLAIIAGIKNPIKSLFTYARKYISLKNIRENFFLIVASLLFIGFFVYAFFDDYCRWKSGFCFHINTFKYCLIPCFCLCCLHYLSKIARAFVSQTKSKDGEGK